VIKKTEPTKKPNPPPSSQFISLIEEFRKKPTEKPKKKTTQCNVCFKNLPVGTKTQHMEEAHESIAKAIPPPSKSFVSLCTDLQKKPKFERPEVPTPGFASLIHDIKKVPVDGILNKPKESHCRICFKVLEVGQRTQHENEFHPPPHPCDLCPKIMKTVSGLDFHKRTIHYGISKFCCRYCGKCVSSNRILVDHEMTHTGEKPYACPHCNKYFSCLGNLKTHTKFVHENFRKFFCHVCGMGTVTLTNLKVHLRTHFKDMERTYVCHLCPKSFLTNYHLKRHVLTHGKSRKPRKSKSSDGE